MYERSVLLRAALVFLTAVVKSVAAEDHVSSARRPNRRRRSKASAVELEIDVVSVKISSGADAGVIAVDIEALKATR